MNYCEELAKLTVPELEEKLRSLCSTAIEAEITVDDQAYRDQTS